MNVRWEAAFLGLVLAGAVAEASARSPENLTPGGDDVEAALVSARQLRKQGRPAEAAAALEPIHASHPEDERLLALLGLCLLDAGDGERAGELAQTWSGYAGTQHQVFVFLGREAERRGRTEEAAAAYEQALARHGDAIEALVGLIGVDRRAGRFGRALKNAEHLETLLPEVGNRLAADVLLAQAERFSALGPDMIEAALAKLRAARARLPGDRALAEHLLDLLVVAVHFEEAAALALATFPGEEGRADRAYWRAQIEDAAQRVEPAKAFYEEALALDPTHAAAALGLAKLHLLEGDASRAREWLDVARRSQPDSARGALLLGEALLELGEAQEAETWLRRADGLDPDNVKTLYRLGRLLVADGRRDEGLRLLERVRALADPEAPEGAPATRPPRGASRRP